MTIESEPAVPAAPADVPATAPAAPPAPLEHVRHAEVFREQLAVYNEGFRTAILALQTEHTGNETAYKQLAQERERDYLDAKRRRDEEYERASAAALAEFERARDAAEDAHGARQRALEIRINDLTQASKMAEAGQQAAEPQGLEGEER